VPSREVAIASSCPIREPLCGCFRSASSTKNMRRQSPRYPLGSVSTEQVVMSRTPGSFRSVLVPRGPLQSGMAGTVTYWVVVVRRPDAEISYSAYRFPPEIKHTIWLYLRYTLSGFHAEISLNPCSNLQHLQRSTQERTEPFGARRCRLGARSSPRREPDVPEICYVLFLTT
jgi:hypothetical protein